MDAIATAISANANVALGASPRAVNAWSARSTRRCSRSERGRACDTALRRTKTVFVLFHRLGKTERPRYELFLPESIRKIACHIFAIEPPTLRLAFFAVVRWTRWVGRAPGLKP